jgi:hypothetical protein
MTNERRHFTAENLIRRAGTRRGLLKSAGVLAGMTALFRVTGKVGSDMAVASPDTTQSILNGALTAEQIATVFYYEGVVGPMHDADNLNYFQAGLWEEYQHIQLLKNLGGTSLTGSDSPTFYFPDDTFRSQSTYLSLFEKFETAFVGAYLAAVHFWASTNEPVYAEAAAQLLGVEAEHRAMARLAAGIIPPNNLVVEDAIFGSVSEAVDALMPYVQGGPGYTAHSFPSIAQIEAAATSSIIDAVSNPELA